MGRYMGNSSFCTSINSTRKIKMFDCKLHEGANLKKCINALKELIDQAAWDISEDGIQLQSMDSSHVALVQMNISAESFEPYRCDQAMQIGLNMGNLHKILARLPMEVLVSRPRATILILFSSFSKRRKTQSQVN